MKFIITACMVCNLLLEHALLDFNRPLVKSVRQKNIFLISQPKHMLWVL